MALLHMTAFLSRTERLPDCQQGSMVTRALNVDAKVGEMEGRGDWGGGCWERRGEEEGGQRSRASGCCTLSFVEEAGGTWWLPDQDDAAAPAGDTCCTPVDIEGEGGETDPAPTFSCSRRMFSTVLAAKPE